MMLSDEEKEAFKGYLEHWGFYSIPYPKDGNLGFGRPNYKIRPDLGIEFFRFNENYRCSKLPDTTPAEKIACCAIMVPGSYDSGIIKGYVHRSGEILIGTTPCRYVYLPWIHEYLNKDKPYHDLFEQGFLTTHGRFVRREEASEIAIKHNQLLNPSKGNPTMLFSEDVWDTPKEPEDANDQKEKEAIADTRAAARKAFSDIGADISKMFNKDDPFI